MATCGKGLLFLEGAMLKKMFGFRLDEETRRALMALAEREERRPSDMLRVLLRREAQRAGLWPEKQTAQSVQVSQAKTL